MCLWDKITSHGGDTLVVYGVTIILYALSIFAWIAINYIIVYLIRGNLFCGDWFDTICAMCFVAVLVGFNMFIIGILF